MRIANPSGMFGDGEAWAMVSTGPSVTTTETSISSHVNEVSIGHPVRLLIFAVITFA